MFWEDKQTLVVGGFQLGRFPESIENPEKQSSLERLQEQLLFFKAQRVILIGGFPLPEHEPYLEEFIRWRERFQTLPVECVLARSNPVAESILRNLRIELHAGLRIETPFVWTASRIAAEKWRADMDTGYMISGYEDPGFKKYGLPKEMSGTPAFYFTPSHGKLPAFSRPKGSLAVKPTKDELLWLAHHDHLERK
jgi:hypothetical protein